MSTKPQLENNVHCLTIKSKTIIFFNYVFIRNTRALQSERSCSDKDRERDVTEVEKSDKSIVKISKVSEQVGNG